MDDAERRADFTAYVRAREQSLARLAYLLTGDRDAAEDLLQNALAKVYRHWDRVRAAELPDAYVRRTMVTTQTSFWRRRRPEHATDTVPERPGRDTHADADLHDALWTALARLGKRQRATVVLRYYEDLSEADTAAVLGVSVGTVKSTTSRALALLRDDPSLRDDPRAALPHGALT